MGYDYKKISTNWNKFLAEGTLKAKEPDILFEEEKVVDKLKKMLLPSMLKNDVAMSLVKQGFKAVKDRKVNLNDLFKVVGGLRLGFKTGDMSAAEDAMKQKGFLDKLGLQLSVGAITQNIKDASLESQTGAKGRDAYMKAMAPEVGKKKDFGQTYGVQATMRFEEWLNADESVSLLTEQFVSAKDVGDTLIQLIVKHGKGKIEHAQAKKIFDELMKIVSPQGRPIGMELDELEKAVIGSIAKVPSR